jgi:hypothetical protein
MSDSIKQILEVFSYNGEYEFDYKNKSYHMEPGKNGYELWEFPDISKNVYKKKLTGKKIAEAKNGPDLLLVKCFDGKSYMEIDEDAKNGILS